MTESRRDRFIRLLKSKSDLDITDINCPECGRKIYLDENIILTSFPARYSYWCSCGWKGYAPTRWCAKMGVEQ